LTGFLVGRPILAAAAFQAAHRLKADASRTHLNPILPVELSAVLELRAATRYRLQYEAWHRYDPPFITLAVPLGGPTGLLRVPTQWKSGENQSKHHSHTLPATE
jgi:hypothetical protein